MDTDERAVSESEISTWAPRMIFTVLLKRVHLWLLLLAFAQASAAQVITLDRPGDREFIVDRADLITPEDEQRIKQTADRLLTDTASPIIVVTIESMSNYTRRNMTIETFARVLFDQWGIGHLKIGDQPLNTGVL